MSAASCSQDNSNQFIRPKFDLHSATARLALMGEGFASYVVFANAISGGVHAEFVDALLKALGYHSDALGSNDLCAIVDLYNAVPSACDEADVAVEIPAPDTENNKDNAVACPEREFPPPWMMDTANKKHR